MRAPTQQRTTLTLGHPAPDPELDIVVECVSEALGADGAAQADGFHSILRSPLHEQCVGIRRATSGLRRPVVVQAHARLTPLWTNFAAGRSRAVPAWNELFGCFLPAFEYFLPAKAGYSPVRRLKPSCEPGRYACRDHSA